MVGGGMQAGGKGLGGAGGTSAPPSQAAAKGIFFMCMSFGDKVTIVRPKSIRQALKAKHEAARKRHKGEKRYEYTKRN